MQKNRQKNQPAQPTRDQKTGADGHAVKERMKAQACHHRVAGMPGDKFAVMCFFAKVEVGVDGVFQQMHYAIAGHDQDRTQRGD